MSINLYGISITEPVYYYREYAYDLEGWGRGEELCATTAYGVSLLYKSARLPISIVMGSGRTYQAVVELIKKMRDGELSKSEMLTSENIPLAMLHAVFSVAGLAAMLFAFPLSLLISTVHDLIIDVIRLKYFLKKDDNEKVREINYQSIARPCLDIINRSLYLTLFFNRKLELTVASLAMQTVTNVYYSCYKIGTGNSIEGCYIMLMAMARFEQLNRLIR